MRMSRFSGYSSGASTTGQRSWGKSEKPQLNKHVIQQNWRIVKGQDMYHFYSVCSTIGIYMLWHMTPTVAPNLCLSPIPRQSVLRKASICSCPTPLAPFWPNSRWESSRCKTSMAMSWKPPSWFPPRSASTYDRRRSGSFCLMNCAAEKQLKKKKSRLV